ncbi:MAG: tetratricopeptide repeat protein [Candidatus Edwardsbacteria bacterium]
MHKRLYKLQNLWLEVNEEGGPGRKYYPYGVYLRKVEILELIGQWQEAEEICRCGLKWAEKTNQKAKIAESQNWLGWMLHQRGANAQAFLLFKSASEIYESINDRQEAGWAISYMGCVYYRQGDYQKAIDCYNKKLEIAEELNDRKGIASALNNIANIYGEQGDHVKSMEFYQRAMEIAENIGDKRVGGVISGNIGAAHWDQGEYQKAIERFQRQADLASELEDKWQISSAIGNMAGIYLMQGDYELANEYLGQKFKIDGELGYKRGISITLSYMGALYKLKKDCLKAEDYYKQAIAIARELQLRYYLGGYLFELADIYFEMNRIDDTIAINSEAVEMAKEIGDDHTIFSCQKLAAKILALTDRPAAVKKFTEMLQQTTEETQIAGLHYELFKLTGANQNKTNAIDMYKNLYRKTPNIQYKERIEELEQVE